MMAVYGPTFLCNVVLTLSLFSTCTAMWDMFGLSYGCFKDNTTRRDLPYQITQRNSADTVETCVDACQKKYYKYAGLQNGDSCFCGGSYGDYGSGTCEKFCRFNSTQSCGGLLSSNIYDTGQTVPGPPVSLEVGKTSENSIQVMWLSPVSPNGIITQYRVTARYVETYSESSILPPLSLTYPNGTSNSELLNLHPGTKYNVSVWADTKDGSGLRSSVLAWTLLGEPAEPEVPAVVKRDKGQMVVRLKPAVNNNGPISAYRIVVIGDGGHAAFDPDALGTWTEAQREGQQFYIAAELTPEALNERQEFVVGDGRTYGRYFNPPLPLEGDIHISLGIVSRLNGVTRVRYALAGHEQHGIVVLDVGKTVVATSDETSPMVVILSIAIGVFGFLLLASIAAYFLLRRKLGRRRRLDNQELSLQGPMMQVDNPGYVHDGFIPEDEEEGRVDHYEKLKNRVWSIPRNFLDVRPDERLGKGVYGDVVRATVQRHGSPVAAAVHVIDDKELSTTNKRFMLQDLDVLIKCGSHPNLVGLVGTCESPDTLFVVLEHHPATLKDVLLESRCLEHKSRGVEHSRFCTLGETNVLETAAGVARAMDHLSKYKIVHKTLCARNVLMADGILAKVTGHGISKVDKGDELLDPTRWMAQEVFRSRHYVTHSDIWAFGCLLWEMTALGGTPYASIRTSEIGPRVMRGLRLPQLPYVGDDLFQLMLQCWELDLDERPSFADIARVLDDLAADSTVHLNFAVFDSFHYEPYIAEFERRF